MEKLALILVLFVYPSLALAYIDPGTGSAIIQGLIAAIAAIGVTIKLYWHKLVSKFSRQADVRDSDEAQKDVPENSLEK